MRSWAALLFLVHSLLAQHGADGKRFDPSMVDPLMRRSTLDKNFMRFGRSSPAYTEEEEVDDVHDSTPAAETDKEDSFLRSMRGKQDNFMRFGKGKQDNYMRFGRGKQDNFIRFGKALNDNFMRFGRGKQDNFIRFGRGKQDNFIRFGRGKQDNFMRFGRGKQDSFIRFGRGKQDNFMRFGRGKQDNYMRFGRGKQDNFMRFGRDFEDLTDGLTEILDKDEDLARFTRGKQDNYMRFGRNFDEDPDEDIHVALRASNPQGNSNFIRFGRARQDGFMRFGKADSENVLPQFGEESDDSKTKTKEIQNYPVAENDEFKREAKSRDSNLMRFGRQPPSKNDGFIRFGRDSPEPAEDSPHGTELIPQRLKRSPALYDPQKEMNDHVLIPLSPFPVDSEEEYLSPSLQEDYTNRRKRSLSTETSPAPPVTEEDSTVDFVSAKVRFDAPANSEFRSSLLSAGIPNVIVGPEFSLLPDLEPPSTMLKRGRPGDQSFLRLG